MVNKDDNGVNGGAPYSSVVDLCHRTDRTYMLVSSIVQTLSRALQQTDLH